MTAPAQAPSRDTNPQAAQAGLAAVVAAQIPGLLAHLNPHDIRGTQQNLLALLVDMVRRCGAASATLATRQYRAVREAAGVTGGFTVMPADPAPVEQIAKALNWALSGLYGPNPDVQAFETKLTGLAEKMTLDPGRQTIVDNVARDRKARGWARIPEAGACAFCAMLATRGAVYKEHSFDRANARFKNDPNRPSEFKTHDHCHCHAEPVFGQYEPSPQIQQWQELYSSIRHGKPAVVRANFRRAYNAAQ